MPSSEWDTLITTLTALHDHQREAELDKRRGHRPRKTRPGAGRRPTLTLVDRLLATLLHDRLALPQTAVAALFGVRPDRSGWGLVSVNCLSSVQSGQRQVC